MSILDEISRRFEELIAEGVGWAQTPLDGRDSYYLDPGARGWLTAAVSLTETVTQGRGAYFDEIKSLTTHPDLRVGVPKQCVEMGVTILKVLHTDWCRGLIRNVDGDRIRMSEKVTEIRELPIPWKRRLRYV
jgi:hypothetical protein